MSITIDEYRNWRLEEDKHYETYDSNHLNSNNHVWVAPLTILYTNKSIVTKMLYYVRISLSITLRLPSLYQEEKKCKSKLLLKILKKEKQIGNN